MAPEQDRASEYDMSERVAAAGRRMRRELPDDYDTPSRHLEEDDEDDFEPIRRRRGGLRVRFGGLPKTRGGRIFAGTLFAICLVMLGAFYLMVRSFLLHDERFTIPSSEAIEFTGNANVARSELLSIFGEDVERNIFKVPLAERRAEIEQIPWVAHATVMRLLPNHIRVAVIERTPVAFVRQGSHIGLVDANGVLLDMPVDNKPEQHYSFPVVTGVVPSDPLSTRAARMKIYQRFTSELDSSGEKVSEQLSEVDLSNPEDVKALIPDHSTDILVHFGDSDFLDRYRRFEQHLSEWRTVYPHLSSVDMRYERQVVLEMAPGTMPDSGKTQPQTPAPAHATAHPAATPAPKPSGKAAIAKPAAPKPKATPKPVAKKPAPKSKTPAKPPAKNHSATPEPQYHPPQVVHP